MDNRLCFRWRIRLPDGSEYGEADLKSGTGVSDGPELLQRMFEALLSFLGACAESIKRKGRYGQVGENADLFPLPVAEWASENDDEIGSLKLEIESTPGLIEEDEE